LFLGVFVLYKAHKTKADGKKRLADAMGNLVISAILAAFGLAGVIVYLATPQPSTVFCYTCDMPRAFFGLVIIDELFLCFSLVWLAVGICLLALSSWWLLRVRAAASGPTDGSGAASKSEGGERGDE